MSRKDSDKQNLVIKLLDSAGKRVIDSVSGDYEDSFSIETFADIIEAHQNAGNKQMIIARVQTWDLRQPEREFFSYYNAYQLNRILFQTQVYLSKKLIHRMHVLNPLTNSDIIGHVLYFAVCAQPSTQPPSPSVAAVDRGLPQTWTLASQAVAAVHDEKEYQELSLTPQNKSPSTSTESGQAESSTPLQSMRNSFSVARNAVIRRISIKDQKTRHPLTVFPKKVDESGSPNLQGDGPEDRRKSFAIRTPVNKPSTRAGVEQTQPLAIKSEENGSQQPQQLRTAPVTVSIVEAQDLQKIEVGASRVPDRPLLLNNHLKSRVTVPPGVLTRFAITFESPLLSAPAGQVTSFAHATTPPRRQRRLSLRNSMQTSGKLPDYSDWSRHLSTGAEIQQNTQEATKNADDVRAERNNDLELEPKIESKLKTLDRGVSFARSTKGVVYNAVLIATDMDFLEKANIRAIFRKNAVAPEDTKLFELPEFTGVDHESLSNAQRSSGLAAQAPGEPRVFLPPDDSDCLCCMPRETDMRNMSPFLRCLHYMKIPVIMTIVLFGIAACVVIGLTSIQSRK